MAQQEFEQWVEELKENAISDFGYSKSETENFNLKNWKKYYEQGLSPFESIIQYLKSAFKHQNGQ
jgi:hypothetical protein